jgi:hypothetical protein
VPLQVLQIFPCSSLPLPRQTGQREDFPKSVNGCSWRPVLYDAELWIRHPLYRIFSPFLGDRSTKLKTQRKWLRLRTRGSSSARFEVVMNILLGSDRGSIACGRMKAPALQRS